MRRVLSVILAIVLCVCMAVPAFAAGSSVKLTYDLTAEGSTLSGTVNEVKAKQNDVITVTYTVKRTDASSSYALNSIQNEIKFNKSFFEFVEGSVTPKEGADGGLIEKIAGTRVYLDDMNKTYDATTVAGTFQLKVKASGGSGMVECSECLAYDGDGNAITITCQNLKVTIADEGGGGGTGGGGGGGGGAPADNAVVPVSGDTNSIKVEAKVSGTEAALVIDTDDLNTVINKNIETGTVEIDLTALNKDITTTVIPNAALKAITDAANSNDNDADGLTIKLSDGSVTFDAAALKSIAQQTGSGDLKLVVDDTDVKGLNSTQESALEDFDLLAVYDIYMTANGKRITNFDGGKASVTVRHKLESGQKTSGIAVLYVADTGAISRMAYTLYGNEVVFTVTHFSNYVISYVQNGAASAYLTCPRDATCPIEPFTDTTNDFWWHDGIHYCIDRGLMNGIASATFDPNGTTTRAMIVTILWRMEGSPESNYPMSFADVPAGQWYTEAIRWAQSTGVVTGYDDTTFGPNDPITREQMAAILYRYANYKGIDVSARATLAGYTDVNRISGWALENVKWANAVGMVNGRTATTIVPLGNATRAEAASMIQRFCENVLK